MSLRLAGLFLMGTVPALAVAAEAVKGADLELLEEIRRIGVGVERLRAQSFRHPPVAVRATEAEREAAAGARAADVLPSRHLAARGRAWADLGLGSSDAPRMLLSRLAADLGEGAIDVQARRLLVDPRLLTGEELESGEGEASTNLLLMTGVHPDEPPIAHLLVHLLQIEREARTFGETTDAMLSARAWVEGEANLVATRYLFEGLGLADEVASLRLRPENVLEGRLLPSVRSTPADAVETMVQFVYLEGFSRAVGLFRQGGWAAVEQATSTRRTTSDILHTDRSPSGHEPLASTDPPLAGLVLADLDSLGEQGVITLVSILTGKDSLALLAGDGWAGDVLRRWERPDGEQTGLGITDWHARFGSDEGAANFDYAVGRGFEARFPGHALEGREEGVRVLNAEDRTFRIERRGRDVRVRVAPRAWEAAPKGTDLEKPGRPS